MRYSLSWSKHFCWLPCPILLASLFSSCSLTRSKVDLKKQTVEWIKQPSFSLHSVTFANHYIIISYIYNYLSNLLALNLNSEIKMYFYHTRSVTRPTSLGVADSEYVTSLSDSTVFSACLSQRGPCKLSRRWDEDARRGRARALPLGAPTAITNYCSLLAVWSMPADADFICSYDTDCVPISQTQNICFVLLLFKQHTYNFVFVWLLYRKKKWKSSFESCSFNCTSWMYKVVA